MDNNLLKSLECIKFEIDNIEEDVKHSVNSNLAAAIVINNNREAKGYLSAVVKDIQSISNTDSYQKSLIDAVLIALYYEKLDHKKTINFKSTSMEDTKISGTLTKNPPFSIIKYNFGYEYLSKNAKQNRDCPEFKIKELEATFFLHLLKNGENIYKILKDIYKKKNKDNFFDSEEDDFYTCFNFFSKLYDDMLKQKIYNYQQNNELRIINIFLAEKLMGLSIISKTLTYIYDYNLMSPTCFKTFFDLTKSLMKISNPVLREIILQTIFSRTLENIKAYFSDYVVYINHNNVNLLIPSGKVFPKNYEINIKFNTTINNKKVISAIYSDVLCKLSQSTDCTDRQKMLYQLWDMDFNKLWHEIHDAYLSSIVSKNNGNIFLNNEIICELVNKYIGDVSEAIVNEIDQQKCAVQDKNRIVANILTTFISNIIDTHIYLLSRINSILNDSTFEFNKYTSKYCKIKQSVNELCKMNNTKDIISKSNIIAVSFFEANRELINILCNNSSDFTKKKLSMYRKILSGDERATNNKQVKNALLWMYSEFCSVTEKCTSDFLQTFSDEILDNKDIIHSIPTGLFLNINLDYLVFLEPLFEKVNKNLNTLNYKNLNFKSINIKYYKCILRYKDFSKYSVKSFINYIWFYTLYISNNYETINKAFSKYVEDCKKKIGEKFDLDLDEFYKKHLEVKICDNDTNDSYIKNFTSFLYDLMCPNEDEEAIPFLELDERWDKNSSECSSDIWSPYLQHFLENY